MGAEAASLNFAGPGVLDELVSRLSEYLVGPGVLDELVSRLSEYLVGPGVLPETSKTGAG